MHPKFREGLERMALRNSRLGSMSDLAGGGEPPHDGGMEARVAKLEATAEYILRDVGEIKTDLKSTNAAVAAFAADVNREFKAVDGEFKAVRAEAKSDFQKLFGALIAVALGLAGIMAKGFHWI